MRNEPDDDAVIAMADELAKHQTGLGGKTTAPCPALHAAHEPVLAAPRGPGRSPRNAGQHQAASELIVVPRLTVASGAEDAALAALPRLIAASRIESGNLDFDGYRSLSDRGQYLPFRALCLTNRSFQDSKAGQSKSLSPRLAQRNRCAYDIRRG
jgi:hypothetical protein